VTGTALYRGDMTLDRERWRPPVAIAHRGSRVLWPENTVASFQGAYDLGYRHFETDLHMTADGVLVCFHDPTVDRTTDAVGRVEDLTLEELQSLDAGHKHATPDGHVFRGDVARVPTLEWLLTTFPDTSVIVDMKTDGLAGPLAELIDRLGVHERLIVGSFSDKRIAEFRVLTEGKVPTSVGPRRARLWFIASRIGLGAGSDASALQLPTHERGIRVIDEKLVSTAHAKGLQVHAWTVNTLPEMELLLDIGVDGLITDRADLLRDLLVERGEWRPA